MDRPTDVRHVFTQQERRFLCGVGVAGIPEIVGEIESFGAVIIIGSRLGQNLDTTGSQPVIFWREGILIDAHFPNLFLRRSHPAAESINQKRSATRTCSGPGDRDEVGQKVVRIVG